MMCDTVSRYRAPLHRQAVTLAQGTSIAGKMSQPSSLPRIARVGSPPASRTPDDRQRYADLGEKSLLGCGERAEVVGIIRRAVRH